MTSLFPSSNFLLKMKNLRFKDHSLSIRFIVWNFSPTGRMFWTFSKSVRCLLEKTGRDSASLNGRGWVEGIEHRGEACLGSYPTGTPLWNGKGDFLLYT